MTLATKQRFVLVCGFPDYRVSRSGIVESGKQGGWRRLTLHRHRSGYVHATLYKNGRAHTVPVHRLVLAAFVGACPHGYEAAHNNGRRNDNRVNNLRWASSSDNKADRWRHGTMPIGARNGRAKLTRVQVLAIGRALEHTPRAILAARYDVTVRTIGRIANGETWRNALTA